MCAQKSSSQRKDPYGNYRFRVEIDGIAQAAFTEVTIPDSTSEVIVVRNGTDPTNTVRRQSGLLSNGNLVLKWGMTASLDLYTWRKAIEQGKIGNSRKNLSVVLIDEEGNDVARWDFSNAWPSRYKGPDLNAQGNEVAIETLEIVFESMVRSK